MDKCYLKDIAKVDISNVDKKYVSGETIIKLCNFIDVYNNWEITDITYKNLMVATATRREIEKFELRKGMIAITKDSETRDDIGMATLISCDYNDMILGYHTALICPNNNLIDSNYLNAYLQSSMSRKYFSNNASGSGQRYTLTLESIENLPVYLPPKERQIKIGSLFSCINQKIETNSQINTELESLAKTIYDYWFLQFDFPNKEGKPYKSSGGAMVWNEDLKMEIPEGWEVTTLGKIIVEQPKSTIPVEDVKAVEGNIPFFTSGKSILRHSKPIVTGRNCYLNTGGKSGIKYYAGDASYSTDTWCIKGTDNMTEYLYLFLKTIESQLDRIFFAGSTDLKHLQKPLLKQQHIIVPPKDVLSRFNEIIWPSFDMISENIRQNQELDNLRDFLLPLLINGQVGFKDA